MCGDIIAFQSDSKGIVVDPTIRFKMRRHLILGLQVHEEEKRIGLYEPSTGFLKVNIN